MAWTTWYDWTAGDTATASRLDQIATNVRALVPVGAITYVVRAGTSVETLVDDCWLECNGASVLRATYPDLNTLLSSLSYPFGSADGTHMTLPDLRGRQLVAMAASGHTDVNGLGDNDGVSTVSSRTPKNAAHTHTGPSHTHSFSATSGGPSATASWITNGSAGSAGDANHTHSVSGTTGSGGTGNTGSGGAYSGSFYVAGVYLIKAVN